ncbi:TB2/DP1, HVA22 family-domain-containing protein [Coniochaeta sp. 2T2.1]|nr:TB2/DP1, HVA22 family-domain-containing protein [Coniochaeta sp. 2T2.1]
MFDIFAKLLSSIASFLFPLFASYKALQTSDPAQLTPWLMYWVVLACALLVESWTDWFLVWIPFYAYLRLLFLLYLVLPQTQGARIIYQTHIQPWLHENEQQIEDFIASAHHRLKQAGINYLKRAIELLRTNVLGLPPSPPSAASAADVGQAGQGQAGQGQSYTQTLLARFSLPAARWGGKDALGGTGASDFYNLLASAVGAATGASSSSATQPESGLVPDNIQGASAKMSFISAQRERLALLMTALDKEASQLQNEAAADKSRDSSGVGLDGTGAPLTKSRSEADFEKLEAESGEEEDAAAAAGARRRTPGVAGQAAGWVSWAWGGGGGAAEGAAREVEGKTAAEGKSTAVDTET